MTGWTHHTPRWAVASACGIAAVLLLVGAVAHVTDLLGHGLHPYDWAPRWLNLYWSSLALFDTLAAVLLLRGHRRGLDLACAIMVTDLVADWYAVYGIQHSDLAAQPGLQRLAVFAARRYSTSRAGRQNSRACRGPIVRAWSRAAETT